ncbi:hypothetical protein Drorol1_Dr00014908 [Drosera rotundifolia]
MVAVKVAVAEPVGGDVCEVFDEMPERDVVAVTVLVVEFAKRGEMGFAREVFDGVVEGNKDVVAWRSLA